MSVEFRVSGVKRTNAKIKRIGSYIRGKYSIDLVNIGYEYARRHSPKDTGALMRAISRKKGKQSAKLLLYNPRHRDGRDRPYHLWMHGIRAPAPGGKGYDTSKGKYKPKSGDPMFMFNAQKKMRSEVTETLKKEINKL